MTRRDSTSAPVAILRVEQLYPWPGDELASHIARYEHRARRRLAARGAGEYGPLAVPERAVAAPTQARLRTPRRKPAGIRQPGHRQSHRAPTGAA